MKFFDLVLIFAGTSIMLILGAGSFVRFLSERPLKREDWMFIVSLVVLSCIVAVILLLAGSLLGLNLGGIDGSSARRGSSDACNQETVRCSE